VEVLLERSAHDSTVSVGRESTRQHRDVSEGGFQRLVENVTDLVLEVLGGYKGVEEVLPALSQHSVNLTASTTEILVVVETFPEGEKGLGTGLCTSIEQNADFGVQNATDSSEEPSVGVDLLAVLLLQAEHHLDWGKCAGAVIVRANELLVGRNGKLRGVFELSC
jgi:hypothetical protein